MQIRKKIALPLLALALLLSSCSGEQRPRLSMFIGVDISGSFVNGKYFDDSLKFLATYIFSHLNGLGELEKPNVLFVGSIGGASADEPKTFYPIQTFEGKTVEEIEALLHKIFPKDALNPYTDFNAFFQQVALTVKNKNLVLKPVSVVVVRDDKPDIKKNGKTDFRSLNVSPLERLSRNVTLRLLYTSAVVGMQWQTEVPRKRIKVWTQDDKVMETWKDPDIFEADSSLQEQPTYFAWVQDNVDFGVRARRVD